MSETQGLNVQKAPLAHSINISAIAAPKVPTPWVITRPALDDWVGTPPLVVCDALLAGADVGVGVVLKLRVVGAPVAPGSGTTTVPPKISELANVLHIDDAGTVPAPPGGSCESPAQDSNTPSRALEGALNAQPWVS